MNERHVTFLIKQIKSYVEELECEIRNHPEDYVSRPVTYEEVKMYEEYNDDDGYPD